MTTLTKKSIAAIACDNLISTRADALNRPILNGISCRIEQGEFVALLGLNGAGKTTLLRSLVGLTPLQKGEVRIHDQALTGQSLPRLRRQVSLILQGGGLVGQLSALENVLCGQLGSRSAWQTLWGFPRRDRQRGQEILTTLGLGPQVRQKTSKLSGGQRQRVAIARALMQSSQILLADEPTAGLDVQSTQQVMQIFAQLNREQGKTVVMVVHDLELARIYAERAIVLDQGKLVYDGPCATLAPDLVPVSQDS